MNMFTVEITLRVICGGLLCRKAKSNILRGSYKLHKELWKGVLRVFQSVLFDILCYTVHQFHLLQTHFHCCKANHDRHRTA